MTRARETGATPSKSRDTHRAGVRPGRIALLLLALGSTLVFLVLLELGSYLFGSFERPRFPLRTHSAVGLGRYDDLLFWSLSPDSTSFDGLARTNRPGLRGPEVGDREAAEFRVLSLGESTTFGWEVPYAACYSALLEGYLDGAWPERRVRVINAGVPGYTLLQGFLYLEQRGVELHPDSVLLYFGHNDLLEIAYLAARMNPAGDSNGLTDWELYELRRGTLWRSRAFLTRHSNLFRGLRRALVSDSGAAPEIDPQGGARVPNADRGRLLEMFRTLAAARGFELVVVIPWYANFDDHIPLLRDFAARHPELKVVDLPALLADVGAEENFIDDLHPTAAGHQLIARHIADALAVGSAASGGLGQGAPQ